MKNKPIRILHVIGIMDRGGAETMIMNLYRHTDHSKIQFDFVENTQENGLFENEIIGLGGRIYHCPRFTGNIFVYSNWWKSFFDSHADEYMYVHGHLGSTAAIYLSVAKKYGIKTIAHSHNVYGNNSIKTLEYKTLSFPTRYIADYLFACSNEAGIDRFGKRKEFKIIRNSIDIKKYVFNRGKRKQIRSELKIQDDSLVIGNVGRFYEQKNHSFLLEVFREIYIKNSKAVLMLVGDGPLKNDIVKYAEKLGILENTLFLGIRDDIPELLSAMDVMVFPSLYEGFGIAALEAQANGLRVLCSDQVSKECCITNLFVSMSLDEGSGNWAERVMELYPYERVSPSTQIQNAGFDIEENAKWLESFYLKGELKK